MDRRNFLRTGSLAMLGSLAVPSLAMPASVRGALGGVDNQSAVASAMVHFGVTEADLKKVELTLTSVWAYAYWQATRRGMLMWKG